MRLFAKSPAGLFASQSLTGHLIRGVAALALIAWAVGNEQPHPGLALLAGVAALVAFRGCPICWAVGLIETISHCRPGATKAGSPPAR